MRILLLGGTGNLGKRLIPALQAHGHVVIAYVRSVPKLQSLISPALFEAITTYQGDALDSAGVEAALRKHNCDAIMQTSGNRVFDGSGQILGKIATSVSSAAIRVGKDRGKLLRVWFIGGLGSLEYPGTGWQIQDYMPQWGGNHHKDTEDVMRTLDLEDIEWSLLCVAWMRPKTEMIELLEAPQHHRLAVAGGGKPPEWRDSWIRSVPFLGVFLNLVPAIVSYTTKLEDVADLLAEDFDKGSKSEYLGQLVGMKDVEKAKTI